MTNQLSVIRTNLEKMRPEFARALPPHITPDKLVRSVLNAVQGNKQLQFCSVTSILKSAMTAAILGLEVDNALGQGYILPYKGQAQFIPGYKGYITLAYNSGYIVSGEVVREKDTFAYSLGLNQKLEHTPAAGNITDRGSVIYSYALARHKDNPSVFVVLDKLQLHAKRDRSSAYKAYKNGKLSRDACIWETDYEAMCIKTAIRTLAPQLPLNVQRAAALETMIDVGKGAVYIDHENNIQVDDKKTNNQPSLEEITSSE